MYTYADFDSYQMMVKALVNNWPIDYGDVTCVNNKGNSITIKRSDINVGKASVELQALGFSPYFIYDRAHFEQAMLEEQTSNKDDQDPTYHGHDLSEEELLSLPKLLNNPEIIMTSPKIKTDFYGRESKALEFLCKNEDTGKYYKIIVAPQDTDQGHITNLGKANKVISFFRISNENLTKDFNEIEDGTREVLYFDSSKSREKNDHLPMKLRYSDDIAKKITGKYIPFIDKGIQRRIKDFKRAVGMYVKSKANKNMVMFNKVPTFDHLESDIKEIEFTDAIKKQIINNGRMEAANFYFQKLKVFQKRIDILIGFCYTEEGDKLREKFAKEVTEKYKKGVKEVTDALRTHLEKINKKLDKIMDGEIENDNNFIERAKNHLNFIKSHLPEINKQYVSLDPHYISRIVEELKKASDAMVRQVDELLEETRDKCRNAQFSIDRDYRDKN